MPAEKKFQLEIKYKKYPVKYKIGRAYLTIIIYRKFTSRLCHKFCDTFYDHNSRFVANESVLVIKKSRSHFFVTLIYNTTMKKNKSEIYVNVHILCPVIKICSVHSLDLSRLGTNCIAKHGTHNRRSETLGSVISEAVPTSDEMLSIKSNKVLLRGSMGT